MLPEKDRKRVRFLFSSQSAFADYYITNFRGFGFEEYPPATIAYSIDVLNSTIVSVIKLHKDDDIAQARNYIQDKKYDSAIVYFNKVPAYGPDYFNTQLETANAFFALQNYDSAEARFNKALRIKIDDADALNGLGCVYFSKKQLPQAIDVFKKAIAVNTGLISAYSNLGRIYFISGQHEEAAGIFRKELAIDPTNKTDIPVLANCYRKMGNADSAVKYEGMGR
jgi:tetratricopeptide (TPR) repeat protein